MDDDRKLMTILVQTVYVKRLSPDTEEVFTLISNIFEFFLPIKLYNLIAETRIYDMLQHLRVFHQGDPECDEIVEFYQQ